MKNELNNFKGKMQLQQMINPHPIINEINSSFISSPKAHNKKI